MKNSLKITGIVLLILFQSCYFGAGLVEEQLTDGIELMAINSLDEAQIIYRENNNGVYYSLVSPVVYSVGHDNNFIIAKSHPIDSYGVDTALTFYHIIEVNKVSIKNHEESTPLTSKQFLLKRKQLNIPNGLEFTITLK